MRLIWFLQLVSLGVFLNTDTCGGAVPPCRPNWFGSPCRYECHCVNNKCDASGECTESSTCERPWFGPSCQYVDLASTSMLPSTPAWVFDFPDTLCNPGQETVTVSLDNTYYFTFLRLRGKNILSRHGFKLQLITPNSTSVECSNMYTSAVSDTVVDIHCQPGAFFRELIITGDGVKSLCAVYVSGGRNVALGQETTQTSDFENSASWRAVDGDRNPVFTHESCSHTNLGDNTPTWKLSFQRPHYVNRYVIYNRDNHQERLRRFVLEAVLENGNVAFIYIDHTTINQNIYRIQSTAPRMPVSSVIIIATGTTINETFLTLCEVEMFGDTVCPLGQYGKECENRCNCAKAGENCFVSTGGCPSGCAAGYRGEECQNPCSATYYGENCVLSCSSNCVGRLCNATNGSCQSCMVGRAGLFCDEACPDTTFGEGCRETCSTNCSSQLCDPVTGQCASCEQGSGGDYCNHTLSVNEPDESSPVAAIVGPVVAFVVTAALIVAGVFIWRRHMNTKDDRKETTLGRFQNSTESNSTRTGKSKTVTTKTDNYHEKSADSPYEIPMASTAVMQKVQQLKSEESAVYENDTTANPYDSIADIMPNPDTTANPYESIADTMPTQYEDINEM